AVICLHVLDDGVRPAEVRAPKEIVEAHDLRAPVIDAQRGAVTYLHRPGGRSGRVVVVAATGRRAGERGRVSRHHRDIRGWLSVPRAIRENEKSERGE